MTEEQLPPRRIEHVPGMAADLMQQLKPYLLADGIDLDNPDPENPISIDELNAALLNAGS